MERVLTLMFLTWEMSVKKTIPVLLAFVRTVCLCLPIVFVFSLFVFSGFAFAAASCSTPGKDGVGTPSGGINTYYPGTASVSAGATSIPVGAPSGSATAIAAGDLLLITEPGQRWEEVLTVLEDDHELPTPADLMCTHDPYSSTSSCHSGRQRTRSGSFGLHAGQPDAGPSAEAYARTCRAVSTETARQKVFGCRNPCPPFGGAGVWCCIPMVVDNGPLRILWHHPLDRLEVQRCRGSGGHACVVPVPVGHGRCLHARPATVGSSGVSARPC